MSLCEKLFNISSESKLKIDKYITEIYQNAKSMNEIIDSDQLKFKLIWKIIIEGKYYPEFVYTKMWNVLLEIFPYKSFVKLKVNNYLIQKTFVNLNYSYILSNRERCRIFIVNLFSNFVLFLSYYFTNYTKKLKMRIKYPNKKLLKYINKYNSVLYDLINILNILSIIFFGKKILRNLSLKNNIRLALKHNDIKKLLLSFYEFKIIDTLPSCLPIILLYSTNIIDPSFWGSLVWRNLHYTSEILRIKKIDSTFKKYTFFLFNKFYRFIPCDLCKNHWKILIENNKNCITNISSENLNNLLWKFHYEVSKTKPNLSDEITWENYINSEQKFYEKLIYIKD